MKNNIYLTEMSLKELLEGKEIYDGDDIIHPPRTDELGIMVEEFNQEKADEMVHDEMHQILRKAIVDAQKIIRSDYDVDTLIQMKWACLECKKTFEITC